MLIINLILMFVWVSLNGAFAPVDFLVGFAFGFLITALSQRVLAELISDVSRHRDEHNIRGNYLKQTLTVLSFIGFALWSIIKSNIDVAKLVLSPRLHLRPGIVAIPVDLHSDAGITTFANLITLTPGTVTLDVSSDRKTIYIHVIDVDDVEALRRSTKEDFEQRVHEIFP